MVPLTLTTNTSTPEGSHNTQQDIRPRWGRLITTTLEQEYAFPMESLMLPSKPARKKIGNYQLEYQYSLREDKSN